MSGSVVSKTHELRGTSGQGNKMESPFAGRKVGADGQRGVVFAFFWTP